MTGSFYSPQEAWDEAGNMKDAFTNNYSVSDEKTKSDKSEVDKYKESVWEKHSYQNEDSRDYSSDQQFLSQYTNNSYTGNAYTSSHTSEGRKSLDSQRNSYDRDEMDLGGDHHLLDHADDHDMGYEDYTF